MCMTMKKERTHAPMRTKKHAKQEPGTSHRYLTSLQLVQSWKVLDSEELILRSCLQPALLLVILWCGGPSFELVGEQRGARSRASATGHCRPRGARRFA